MQFRLLAAAICFALAAPHAPSQERPRRAEPQRAVERRAWETSFDHPIEFQFLADADTLVVGTARHLYGVDPRTGRQRWRARDMAVQSEDILTVPGTPILLVNHDVGGKFSDKETTVLAIDRASGREVWESKLIKGKGLQVVADPDAGVLVLVTVKEPHGDDKGLFAGVLPGDGIGGGFDRKPKIHAVELATGRLLWSKDFDKDVTMRPSLDAELARGGKQQQDRPFDLGLYQLPVIDGDRLFVAYRGLTCYDLRTGERLWRQEYDVREGDLALSDAYPIVDGDVIYTTGEGRIRAIDRATGRRLWQSDDFGVVPEIFIDDRAIYGRLGGRFYHIDDEKWVWRGSYGAVALDRATGARIWKYASANDSITNLVIAGDRVWLGDEERLVGLDRATGRKVVAERHRFGQRPVIAGYMESDTVVLISDEEAAGFDPATGARSWYERHPPVGPGFWKRFAAGLMMTSGAVLQVGAFAAANYKGLMPAVPSVALKVSGYKPIPLYNTRGLMLKTAKAAGKGFWRAGEGLLGVTRFAHLTGSHQYFVTRAKGADQALAGVNLMSGATDRLIELPSRETNIAVDETNGLVYQARGKQLVALGF